MAYLPGSERRDLFIIEFYRTGRRRKSACDDVEEGGFPCPVGPDQSEDLTRLEGERDVIKGPEAPEIFCNTADPNKIHLIL